MEPHCDSDEELFIGPLTLKEIRKTLSIRRKTGVFEPMDSVAEDKTAGTVPGENDQRKTFTPPAPRHSIDWNRQSYAPKLSEATSSPEDSLNELCDITNTASNLEEYEAHVTPAPPPSPERTPYTGSPYPTPCPQRTQLCNSLAGIMEEVVVCPPQSTPIIQDQGACLPRFSEFEKFGNWRDYHAISYSSDISCSPSTSKLDDLMEDVLCLSTSQNPRTREILIAKMKEHEEKTQKLKSTKKCAYDDDDGDDNKSLEHVDLSLDADKPTRFSRLIPERNTGGFLEDLECKNGKRQIPAIIDAKKQEENSPDTIERPPSAEMDILVPHAIVTGNYSLISEAEQERSASGIKADEDGGYLSVLSEAAMYHALLEVPQEREDPSKPQIQDSLPKSLNQENLPKLQNEEKLSESQTSENLPESEVQKIMSKSQLTDSPSEPENRNKTSEDLLHSLERTDSESSDDSVVVILNEIHQGREMDAKDDLNESDVEKLKELQSFSSSGRFHDTLEEMELMLELGLDYITEGKNLEDVNKVCEESDGADKKLKNEDVVQEIEKKATSLKPQIPVSKIPQIKPNAQKLQAVVSPTVRVKQSPFKVPATPLAQVMNKKTPLKSTTPLSKKMGHYDKIVSPVGAYIHNSPLLLTKNIKPRTPCSIPKKFRDVVINESQVWEGIENINTVNVPPVLPVLGHHSVPSVKLEQHTEERMPRMNEKMKKLVDTPRPHVMKHEGRVKVTSSLEARRMLCHDSSNAEISVLVDKQVTRTNTLRK